MAYGIHINNASRPVEVLDTLPEVAAWTTTYAAQRKGEIILAEFDTAEDGYDAMIMVGGSAVIVSTRQAPADYARNV